MEEKHKSFFLRLIVVIIGIPLLGYIIFYDEIPFLITVIIFNLIANCELKNILNIDKRKITFFFSAFLSLYFVYVSVKDLMVFDFNHKNLLVFFIVFYFIVQTIVNKNIMKILNNFLLTFFSGVYIGYLSSFLLRIKFLPNGNIFLISLLILVWTNDTAAFIIGTAVGKTKLAPKISPKKTIEGSVAGILFSIASIIIMNQWLNYHLSKLLIIGIIIPVVGQAGDLFESMLKRRADLKDSGKIIPGHGGVLDRFDSLLFAAPIFYYCVTYIH